jgi:hypothetical protein
MWDTGTARGLAIMGVALFAGAGVVAAHGRPGWVAVIGAAGFGLVVMLGWTTSRNHDAAASPRRSREPIQLVPVRHPHLPALIRHVPAARVVRPAQASVHANRLLDQDRRYARRTGGTG